jgi:hypothetical protein
MKSYFGAMMPNIRRLYRRFESADSKALSSGGLRPVTPES